MQYYYLTKKREKFKHLVRKANLKRKKPFVKPSEFPSPQLSAAPIPPLPISLFASTKPKTEDPMSGDEETPPSIPSGGCCSVTSPCFATHLTLLYWGLAHINYCYFKVLNKIVCANMSNMSNVIIVELKEDFYCGIVM